jgi:hypothetical protein
MSFKNVQLILSLFFISSSFVLCFFYLFQLYYILILFKWIDVYNQMFRGYIFEIDICFRIQCIIIILQRNADILIIMRYLIFFFTSRGDVFQSLINEK